MEILFQHSDYASKRSRLLGSVAYLLSMAGILLVDGGCDGPERPAAYTTSGVVRYMGEPVEGADVVFLPVEADGGNTFAFELTD